MAIEGPKDLNDAMLAEGEHRRARPAANWRDFTAFVCIHLCTEILVLASSHLHAQSRFPTQLRALLLTCHTNVNFFVDSLMIVPPAREQARDVPAAKQRRRTSSYGQRAMGVPYWKVGGLQATRPLVGRSSLDKALQSSKHFNKLPC